MSWAAVYIPFQRWRNHPDFQIQKDDYYFNARKPHILAKLRLQAKKKKILTATVELINLKKKINEPIKVLNVFVADLPPSAHHTMPRH